jgi:hypothetical protein
MTNVSFPHWQRHNQRRSRSRLCSSERRTTVSLPKTCPTLCRWPLLQHLVECDDCHSQATRRAIERYGLDDASFARLSWCAPCRKQDRGTKPRKLHKAGPQAAA